MRTWRAQIDRRRVADYERFAAEQSLPMFASQAGFRGLIFGRTGDAVLVVTLWEDEASANCLDESIVYRDTVAAIRAAGLISSDEPTERFTVHGIVSPQASPPST